MKSGKAVGPDDIPVEVWKCLGEAAVEFLTSLFNRVLESERMPEEWRRSVLVPIFKNKGDVQSCSNYRGIKLMSHTMKVWERVVKARLRKVVEICEQQYGFMPRKSTTDAIFALRILMEKYRDGQRELHCVFVDLEKAYDRVPREELWYCMRKSGVAEKYVRVVQDMYERSRTVVRCAVGQTEEFNVEVGLHQGSALSPFLFAIVMDQLSEEVRQESPWTMMFADDIVICSESREQVEENLERWRFALERRGMKVSRSKTEYMCVNEREGSGTVRLQGEEVKKVEEFKYLGSTVQSNGECGKEVKKRVQAGWNGWRKVWGVLCDQKISARIKGKVYRTVVRAAMLYGLETVSLRKRQESELEVAELKMLRFSLGVTRLDRIRNEYIRGTAHVGRLGDKVREARLRWFGHVQRRESEYIGRRMLDMELPGRRQRGRPKRREELQQQLSDYILHTLKYTETVKEFCDRESKWTLQRETELEMMRDIKDRADQITLKFEHVEKAEDKTKAIDEYMRSSFTQITADSRRQELEKELGDVLKNTLEGLEKLHHFLDAVEKLAVTSLFVFMGESFVPKGVSSMSVRSVISAARMVCPLLVHFKRDAGAFFLPSLSTVEVLAFHLDKYIRVTQQICEKMEKKSKYISGSEGVPDGYAPQVGCELEEKERFWSELDEVMESIPTGERVVIGADFNGHVGEGNTGDEEVMGKFGVKERNLEGQMVVDFAKRMDMAVVNTYFQKREEHRVTYKSGGRRTQVDYILCRRGNLKEISDCKVVVGESVARQHRMVVCRMTLMVCKKKRSKIEKKTKWWKLKKEECCEEFRQKLRQALGGQVVLPDDWETTAEVIRETGRKVLGVSSGMRKEDKETWWWNEEVQDSVQRKRLAKKKWDMDRTEENRQEYKELQRRVKREVSKAKQKAYDELYTRLDTREGEKDLYRLARQRDGDGKDVQQVRVIKDRDGRVLTSEESVQRRWKEYFEELMNEENEREKRVEGVNSVEQKVDKIRKDEVRKALKRMKSGKAVGPDDIPVEVWKCLGEAAVEFLASLFNRVLESERMPEEWRRSVLVPIFKNKGDVQSCSNYRGIKLMSHTMKVWERVVEARLRKVVEICEQQYGFMPRKSTTDAIFALRILMEKYRDGQRELHCVFVDLEKAYDRVPREELWYCMRKSGVAEKYVRVVQDMYERSRTVVRCAVGQTEEFNVEVGLHQGSALSPFLFAIVMDQLSEEVRQQSPWTMMFADDIVICSESREQVEENLERWRFALERRGMKVSGSKTEYMCVNEREGSGTVRLQGEEVKRMDESFRLTFLFDMKAQDFIKLFSERHSRMLQFLSDLDEAADQLDKMKLGSNISTVAGSSVGIAGGVLSIVGLALAPVTAGVSLALTLTGVGLGVTSGVNGIVTIITKMAVNHRQTKKAKKSFIRFRDDVQKILDCMDEVARSEAPIADPVGVTTQAEAKLPATAGAVGKSIEVIGNAALRSEVVMAKTFNIGFKETKAGQSITKLAADLPDIRPLAKGTPLALSKTVRAGFIAVNVLFIGLDVYFICKDSISLSKGGKNKAAQLIRSRSVLWRSEVKAWEKIHDHLCEIVKDGLHLVFKRQSDLLDMLVRSESLSYVVKSAAFTPPPGCLLLGIFGIINTSILEKEQTSE
ncbi:hypothetical protein QTP70_009631 [Hemibagrus guttatus]|uniref:ribonuclease H n=1 Tax=Hemibagrus guttatus TaxID=175788 RepID=A0AAE0QFG7_9TELE|nr:hypothetical protein QTP70_009631 [Hemibagrus guttatus]